MNYTQEQIRNATIQELIDMMIETVDSERNQKLIQNSSQFLVRFGIGRPVFSEAFGIPTMDYFQKAEANLRLQLIHKLWTFHVLKDDTPADLDVNVDYTAALEASLFGMKVLDQEGEEPTYGEPAIKEHHDLDDMTFPDFYHSGMMPFLHQRYKDLKELTAGKLNVVFPGFARGPWSIVTILRGFQDIFIDLMLEPEWTHKLLQFAIDSRISWEKQRCEFLGITPQDRTYRWKYCLYRDNYSSDSFEDEVDGNLFSKETFDEFVLPYEKQLADFYGGIGYYHSCGNLTPFLDSLSTLDIFSMLHISAWTDYKKAVDVLPEHVIVQVSLDAHQDFISASESHYRERLQYFLNHAQGRRVDICPDAIYVNGQESLDKAVRFCEIFREELNKSNMHS